MPYKVEVTSSNPLSTYLCVAKKKKTKKEEEKDRLYQGGFLLPRLLAIRLRKGRI
jgi:hypothetical protein